MTNMTGNNTTNAPSSPPERKLGSPKSGAATSIASIAAVIASSEATSCPQSSSDGGSGKGLAAPAPLTPPSGSAPASPKPNPAELLPSLDSAPPAILEQDGKAGDATCTKEDVRLAKRTHFTLEEVQRLRTRFKALTDGRQSLTRHEFLLALEEITEQGNPLNLFLTRMFAAFDLNKNGTVDLEELVDGLSIYFKGTLSERLELIFRMCDLNSDKILTHSELTTVLRETFNFIEDDLADSRINQIVQALFEDFDVNEDGQITLDEFKLQAMKEPIILNIFQHLHTEHMDHPEHVPR